VPAVADASPFRHPEADDSPGFLLWKITAVWQQALSAALGGLGITQTQYAILASLRWFEERQEPATQSHLAEHARLEKMTLSKAIRRLEETRFVKRDRSTSDGRATEVRLTAKGRNIADAAIVAIEDADDRFFASLSARDLAAYRALMRRLVTANSAGQEGSKRPRY
jgi:MarR family transcriptional regulator for hemolysin